MVELQFIPPAATGVGVLASSLLLSSAPPAVTMEARAPQHGPESVHVSNRDAIPVAVMNTADVNIGNPPAVCFEHPLPLLTCDRRDFELIATLAGLRPA